MDFIRQWWDKRLWWVLLGLLALHGLAALVQHHEVASLIALMLIGGGVMVVSFRSLSLGMCLAFLEIFIGGHGHLIQADVFGFSLSLRIVIFLAVMASWLLLLLMRRVKPSFHAVRDLPFALLGVSVLIGAVKGFATNDPAAAFDDMNGYMTILYLLPLISIPWDREQRRELLMTLFVGGVWVAASTLLLFFLFTHLPGKMLFEIYTFVRDARLAEITLLTKDHVTPFLGATPWYFRIFEQSQAIIVALLFILAANVYALTTFTRRNTIFIVGIFALLIAGFAAGQSRSLVIGAVAGFVALSVGVILVKTSTKQILRTKAQGMAGLLLAVVSLFVLIIVPLPPRPDLSEAAFYKEKTDDARDLAVSSRWNLLGPMVDEILSDPIIGSGFGETVTFISDDPRVRAEIPSGEVTTYRFEWGYHDIWLKMGILGLLSFVWYLVTISTQTFEVLRRDRTQWLAVGCWTAIVALFATNIFTPYLNHPIGLGLMLFVLPFMAWDLTPLEAEKKVEIKKSGAALLAGSTPEYGLRQRLEPRR